MKKIIRTLKDKLFELLVITFVGGGLLDALDIQPPIILVMIWSGFLIILAIWGGVEFAKQNKTKGTIGMGMEAFIENIKTINKLEKFIYSKKYLPSILYFGSLGIVIIDIYCNEFTDFEFVPSILETPLYFWFFFITYLASKNLKKNKLTKP
ncbi:MAG: hypothetical protein P8I51_00205 [Polaribacter sp.]|nr:hypothetical protein [Polaribacter sp.]